VRYTWIGILIVLVLAVGYSNAQAPPDTSTQKPNQTAPAKGLTPEEIIQKFSGKETEFYEAWMQYTYKQIVEVRILEVDGQPFKERVLLVYEVVFNDDGTREVKLVRRTGRLTRVSLTPQDEEAFTNINPFALTAKELPLYDLKYIGKERIDELVCYAFSVKPKKIKKDKLYFEGKIWVDDQDLQIVRTLGKPVPQERDNILPEVETLRQVIDNQFWFPVWTHSDSTLYFSTGAVRIEETITYEDYKRFGSKATIRYGTQAPPEKKDK
jgi:hypothetical protein